MAQETLQRSKAATDQAKRQLEEGTSAITENLRDLSLKLIEMAHTNVDAAFEFAHQAATARTPSEVVDLWSTQLPKQLRVLTEQTRELTFRSLLAEAPHRLRPADDSLFGSVPRLTPMTSD